MQQLVVFAVLAAALALFVWGRWRHDLVALICLLALVLGGIVPPAQAFSGFAHPAVITVAAVLIVSRGLQSSGLIGALSHWMLRVGASRTLQLAALCGLVCLASAFMNNVGALAIFMPVAIAVSRKSDTAPSLLLMPLAFGSLLGGLITLVGTPPNIIIAAFRAEHLGRPFGMFSFAPVGAGLAAVGLLFMVLIAGRLLPHRQGEGSEEERFHIQDYITEVRVLRDSKLRGATVAEATRLPGAELEVLGLVRARQRIHAPDPELVLRANDVLIVEADSGDLKEFVDRSGVRLVGGRRFRKDAAGARDVAMVEAVVMPGSPIVAQSAAGIRLRSRYGLNLLALARREKRLRRRIDQIAFQPGDVLLLQGRAQLLDDTVQSIGCLPLADRGFSVGQPRKVALVAGIFAAALLLVVSGLLQVQVAFVLAAVGMVLTGVLPLQEVYASVDWPVIVLLSAMLPVGAALESSGGASLIAAGVLGLGRTLPLWAVVAVLLALTMALSALINNAATVVLMAPVALGIAEGLGASPDPFLMSVAVGASCAFLTPIGHQSNTLVMGPGGYRFSDYLRLGVPMSLLVLAAGVPLILVVWPA